MIVSRWPSNVTVLPVMGGVSRPAIRVNQLACIWERDCRIFVLLTLSVLELILLDVEIPILWVRVRVDDDEASVNEEQSSIIIEIFVYLLTIEKLRQRCHDMMRCPS